MTYRVKLQDHDFKNMSLEKLKEIFTATKGIYPSGYHVNNPDHYIILFERELKFNRNLYEYVTK